MPDYVIVVWLYIFSLIFISLVATNCPIVALGNNFLYKYNGSIFPSLPVSALYGSVIITSFHDDFRLSVIAEQLELSFMVLIFTF